METERQNKFSFLDVEVIGIKDKFTTTTYRKCTFSDVCGNFKNFLPSVFDLVCIHQRF